MTERIVVLTPSTSGTALAQRLAASLPAEAYGPEGSGLLPLPGGSLAPAVTALFGEAAALVFVGAAGVAVRTIAPHLGHKARDPAVLVVDDAGRHVIPLLAGHRGGANALALRLADLLGAEAAITTASETAGLPPVDCIGRQAGFQPEGEEALRAAARALLAGAAVGVAQEAGPPLASVDGVELGRSQLRELPDRSALRAALAAGAVQAGLLVTDRVDVDPEPALALLRPKTLVAGVGTVRGVSQAAVASALEEALTTAGFARASLGALASLDRKADEEGLRALARAWDLPFLLYPPEVLAAQAVPHPSAAVAAAVGTPSVAEAAALVAAGTGAELVLPKLRRDGVTVALARRREGLPLTLANPHAGRGRPGHLAIVGMGPGAPELLTVAARSALRAADVVVGLARYLDLLRPWLGPVLYRPGHLTAEEERVAEAIALAEAGLDVALVSSGDAGVYGMAALAFALLARRGWDGRRPAVDVIPGVTAANAAASLLGAPLANDYAALSLSDRLTPWPEVLRRLDAILTADLVLALYNPTSQGRGHRYREALAHIQAARAPRTVVGVVRNAYRPGQEVRVTTLDALPGEAVDMMTLLIIGNRTTELLAGRMVTSRGYPAELLLKEVDA